MIKIYPQDEAVLRAVNEPIEKFDKGLRELINLMKDDMGGYIGIAAPQIGINKQVIVVKFEKYITMVNPEILDYDWQNEPIKYPERCLSIPDVEVQVPRYPSVKVRYYTYQGEEKEELFRGLKAVAVQHELDHLEGKLIIDYKEEK